MNFTITRGDSLPTLDATLTANGVAQSLVGATAALMGTAPSGAAWTKSMTVIGASAGTVRAAWTSGESAALEAGAHTCFIVVTFGGGGRVTYPEGRGGIALFAS